MTNPPAADQTCFVLSIGIWNLFVIWCLEFDILQCATFWAVSWTKATDRAGGFFNEF